MYKNDRKYSTISQISHCFQSAENYEFVSGGSRISLGGAPTPRGGGGAPTYDFAKFSWKLHEIKRIWVPGGRPSHPPKSATVCVRKVPVMQGVYMVVIVLWHFVLEGNSKRKFSRSMYFETIMLIMVLSSNDTQLSQRYQVPFAAD